MSHFCTQIDISSAYIILIFILAMHILFFINFFILWFPYKTFWFPCATQIVDYTISIPVSTSWSKTAVLKRVFKGLPDADKKEIK